MITGADDFFDLEANKILSNLKGTYDFSGNRVVGYYGEVNAGMKIGLGGEGVYFRGVDTQTHELVEAYYLGATIGVGASPSLFTVGGGSFGFEGTPGQLGGWSIGGQSSAIITSGSSIAITEGFPKLHMQGANTSLGVNFSGGYTYRVIVGDEQIYGFWGAIEQEKHYDYSFSGAQHDTAMLALLNGHGKVEISYPVDGYIFTQTFQRVDNGSGYRINVFEKVTDKNGIPVSEVIAQKYSSDRVWQFEISEGEAKNIRSVEHCFPAGTLITLADHTQKPIEDIRHGDIVLSHDKNGNITPSIVDKLFTNTTDAFIRLSIDDRDDLIATPGHHFLTETGDYMEIGHMAQLGGGQVRIVDTDGSIITAKAERIIYSAETADTFEQAA